MKSITPSELIVEAVGSQQPMSSNSSSLGCRQAPAYAAGSQQPFNNNYNNKYKNINNIADSKDINSSSSRSISNINNLEHSKVRVGSSIPPLSQTLSPQDHGCGVVKMKVPLVEEFLKIDFSKLKSIGFKENHLRHLAISYSRANALALSVDELQESIDAFSVDLKHGLIKSSTPINYFMACLKTGLPYIQRYSPPAPALALIKSEPVFATINRDWWLSLSDEMKEKMFERANRAFPYLEMHIKQDGITDFLNPNSTKKVSFQIFLDVINGHLRHGVLDN